jgi:hypothetical protein
MGLHRRYSLYWLDLEKKWGPLSTERDKRMLCINHDKVITQDCQRAR